MKRRTVRIILVVIVLIGIVGLITWNWVNRGIDDIVNKKPDVAVTAKDLLAAFDKDTASARKMYMDKVVQVTGTIKSVDSSAIVLGEEGTPSEVSIGFDRRHLTEVKSLQPGKAVTVQGICTGYDKSEGDDLLASLGATVQIKSAGIKKK